MLCCYKVDVNCVPARAQHMPVGAMQIDKREDPSGPTDQLNDSSGSLFRLSVMIV